MGSFRVGDEVDFFEQMAPMCHWAHNSLYPAACILSSGGSLFWSSDPDSVELCCPDPLNPVVFELRRALDQTEDPGRGVTS